jgi:UDP-N-acetylglucosamine 2-epimerase (non-hydrolysing)
MQPDVFLNTETGSPVAQMASIMKELEKVVESYKPHLVIVPGDVNSTLAAGLVANKMNIKLAHLESGLRSFDRTMPEEFNRLLTDNMADYFFVTEQSGYDNLLKEGRHKTDIFFVGNTMIDTMVAFSQQIEENDIDKKFNLKPESYVLMTMHRPATVDSEEGLKKLIRIIEYITGKYKLVFPIHPRTIKNLEKHDLFHHIKANKDIILSEPLDYFAFQKLIKYCKFIVTDSGGIQEESTFLEKPCLTLRANTERPVTVILGTNELIPFEEEVIEAHVNKIEKGKSKHGKIPPMWDGKATERIVKILSELL